jgi:hypothetical protein
MAYAGSHLNIAKLLFNNTNVKTKANAKANSDTTPSLQLKFE